MLCCVVLRCLFPVLSCLVFLFLFCLVLLVPASSGLVVFFHLAFCVCVCDLKSFFESSVDCLFKCKQYYMYNILESNFDNVGVNSVCVDNCICFFLFGLFPQTKSGTPLSEHCTRVLQMPFDLQRHV